MAFNPRTETYTNVSSLSTPFNTSVTMPTGTVQGDIMFQFWGWSTATTIDSVPAGWLLVAQNIANTDRYALYFKIAGAGEAGPYTWSWTATAKVRGVCSVYTAGDFHVATGVLTDLTISNTQYRTSDGNIQAAAMTVPFANSPILHFGMVYSVNTSLSSAKPTAPTTGWVEDDNSWNTTSDFMWSVCSYIWTGSGDTGAMNAILDASAVATTKHAFAVALRPKAFSVVAGSGAYTEAGTAVGLKATRVLAAGAGAYSEAGTAVGMRKGYPLVAGAAAFSLAGTVAGLKRNSNVAAGAGVYTEAGTAVGLKATRVLAAGAGAYSLAGTVAGLKVTRSLSASSGAFGLSGSAVLLRAIRLLQSGAGVFALVGEDVTLNYGGGATNYMLGAEGASYQVAGADVVLSYAVLTSAYRMLAWSGEFSVIGESAKFYRCKKTDVWVALPPTVHSIVGTPSRPRRWHLGDSRWWT